MIEKVNLLNKFEKIENIYEPKEVATVNNMSMKLAKVKGPFTWHKHDDSDEMFLVVKGILTIEIEDQPAIVLHENELAVIPKGVVHRPNPENEALIALFEPSDLLNTGDVVNEFTKEVKKI